MVPHRDGAGARLAANSERTNWSCAEPGPAATLELSMSTNQSPARNGVVANPGSFGKVLEITCRKRRLVFVVAGDRPPPPAIRAPLGIEALDEVPHRSVCVHEVAREHDFTLDPVGEPRRLCDRR